MDLKGLLFLIFISQVNANSVRDDEVTARAIRGGYKAEAHELTTSDGYILRLHRIKAKGSRLKTSFDRSGYPVFMLHGLFSSSGQFVQLGNQSLGFYLADNGYDVWMGALRGGKFGMRHVRYSPDSSKFWNFDLDDNAKIDVAEQIDYIIARTRVPRIFIVGVAITTIPITILLAERPEYNEKIIQASLLSSVLWVGNRRDGVIDSVAYGSFYAFLNFLPYFQFEILENLMLFYRDVVCNNRQRMKDFCVELYGIQSLMYGDSGNRNRFDTNYFKDMERYSTPRLGSKFLRHAIQMKMSRQFKKYDSNEVNVVHNSLSTPYYDLRKITTPIRMQWGRRDRMMMKSDYDAFARLAINSNVTIHSIDCFAHGEVLYGKNVVEIVFKDVLEAMEYEISKL